MRWVPPILLVVLTGCIGFGGCRPSFAPLVAEPTGRMLANPDGGPSVECRDLDVSQCDIGFGILADPQALRGWNVGDIDRIIVACVGTCTARGGETRMDVVFADGTSELYANGGYGEFQQSCA